MNLGWYDSIQLTEQEIAAALLEGKKRKYFHEKNRDYWESQEFKPKPVREVKIKVGSF